MCARCAELFAKLEDLPTFNSVAIESEFVQLPLTETECFFFLNDDVMFTNHVRSVRFACVGCSRSALVSLVIISVSIATSVQSSLYSKWRRAPMATR